SRAQLVDAPAPTGYTLLSEDELSALAVEEILADHSATDALKAAANSLRLLDEDTHSATRTPLKTAKKSPTKAPAAASERTVEPAPVSVAEAQSQIPLVAFLRGAGLANRELGAQDTAMLLHLAGQLIRELAVGLRRSIDARVEQRNRLRVANRTIQPQNNNLLNFAASLDEAVENLLFMRKPEYLPAVDAVREGFAETIDHERALLEATHEALKSYLERLDPEDIQQKAEDGGKRGLLGAIGDSKFRARYADIYEALAQHIPGHFPAAFGEAFAAAYERELANRTTSSPSQRAKSG
ncbi:MAG TPA: type VI secretion system-associated FHA domain protein TagH, partial [Gammaproteobacteria bacterium]|nr:type VI secretion system-associated FHA domain protein TagH [Gammaproteobacteria bacterium]